MEDAAGNKVQATGDKGEQGNQGIQGVQGVTPQLQIVDGKWQISYDDGSTWTEIGQATGAQGPQGDKGETGAQGPQGDKGDKGDAFSDVDYTTSKDYVIFTLVDGTQIKLPTWSAFQELQQLVTTMNGQISTINDLIATVQGNITDLNGNITELKDKVYVNDTAPIYADDNTTVIGYRILLSNGKNLVIKHGDKGDKGDKGDTGATGAAGKDAPIIGVAQDSIDFKYYWTITDENGIPQWLGGENNRVQASGDKGETGNTPKLRINDKTGHWEISYDNEQNWIDLGIKAQGARGDSLFKDVVLDDDNYVKIKLTSGAEYLLPTQAVITDLQAKIDQITSDVTSLKKLVAAVDTLRTDVDSLKKKVYVTSVEKLTSAGKETGYIIHFTDPQYDITINHGADAPVVGVKEEGGIYYWTLTNENGEPEFIPMDEPGTKIPVTGNDGKTPVFNIDEDGNLWYKYQDEPETAAWRDLGKVVGDPGKAFDGVEIKDGKVIFTLGDQTIEVPTWEAFNDLREQILDDVKGLQALWDAFKTHKYIKNIEPIENGYKITLSDNKTYDICHGTNGSTPTIKVTKIEDEGDELYWEVNDEIVKDAQGNPIPVTGNDGKTPVFNIDNNGDLWFKYKGESDDKYQFVGHVLGEPGKDGDHMFKQAPVITDTHVTFYLTGGETITVSRIAHLGITYIPEYSDGSASVWPDGNGKNITMLNFKITPGAVAENKEFTKIKAYIVKTKSRSALIPLENAKIEYAYKDGITTFVVSCDDFFQGNQTVSLSLELEYAGATYNTDFINLVSVSTENSILYKSSNHEMVTLANEDGFGATITDHQYLYVNDEAGLDLGIIAFNGPINAIPNNAFNGKTTLKSVTLPSTVTSIGENAFNGCTGLEGSLPIPNSVTSIGASAFASCSKLTGELTLPANVTFIGKNAFQGCKGFTGDLIIPNSVTSIGESAFSGCEGLTGDLTIGSGVRNITNTMFAGTSFKGDLTIGDDKVDPCQTINESAFKNTSMIGKLTIKRSVQTIGESAFALTTEVLGNILNNIGNLLGDNSSLASLSYGFETIVLDNGVETIGANAFQHNVRLDGSLTIPNSVVTIGNNAFANCFQLTELNLGEGTNHMDDSQLKTIGESAFENCMSLDCDLSIPDFVTTIEASAFRNCIGLNGNKLEIGESVKSIGNFAFTINASVDQIDLGEWSSILSSALSYIENLNLNLVTSLGFTEVICWAERAPSINHVSSSSSEINIIVAKLTLTYLSETPFSVSLNFVKTGESGGWLTGGKKYTFSLTEKGDKPTTLKVQNPSNYNNTNWENLFNITGM